MRRCINCDSISLVGALVLVVIIIIIWKCCDVSCQVYYLRKATLKTADKRYSSLNNDYEMTFSSETEVSLCDDDDTSLPQIPSVTYNFVPINQLESHAPNSTVGALFAAIYRTGVHIAESYLHGITSELTVLFLTWWLSVSFDCSRLHKISHYVHIWRLGLSLTDDIVHSLLCSVSVLPGSPHLVAQRMCSELDNHTFSVGIPTTYH